MNNNTQLVQAEFDFLSSSSVQEKDVKPLKMTSNKRPSTVDMVREFHDAFDVHTPEHPFIVDDALNELRCDLIEEELGELREALRERDVVGVLDALTDLQYVLDGAYLALGYSELKQRAFKVVHASNMSKLGPDGKPIVREDGKILKGPDYFPPNLSSILVGD